MTTPPNQRVERDWDKFFSAGHFQCFVDAVGDDGGFVGFDRSTAESVAELANALIRQALADAVTVYAQGEVDSVNRNWFSNRAQDDNLTGKVICIKPIGS